MLKIERVVEPNASIAEQAIHGMRNPMESWDQFDSYEQRGDLFKKYVRTL